MRQDLIRLAEDRHSIALQAEEVLSLASKLWFDPSSAPCTDRCALVEKMQDLRDCITAQVPQQSELLISTPAADLRTA